MDLFKKVVNVDGLEFIRIHIKLPYISLLVGFLLELLVGQYDLLIFVCVVWVSIRVVLDGEFLKCLFYEFIGGAVGYSQLFVGIGGLNGERICENNEENGFPEEKAHSNIIR